MAQYRATNLLEILDGKNKQFVVPIYQRGYNWSEENVVKLLDDLIEFREENSQRTEQKYYVGNIITKEMPAEPGEYWKRRTIVDGQQRITTSILIVLALLKFDYDSFDDLERKIILKNKNESKLKLERVGDENIINKIIYDKVLTPEEKETNMYKNFKVIQKFLAQTHYDKEYIANELNNALENTLLIEIILDSTENENKVFETINSAGMKLSNGDLIKNFLFFGVHNFTEEQEEKLIYQFNETVESKIDKKDFDIFYRYYTSRISKDKKLPKKSGTDIYELFKKAANERHFNYESYDEVWKWIANLAKFANVWDFVHNGSFNNKNINFMLEVSRQNKNTYMPLIADLFERFVSDINDETTTGKIFSIIAESILKRSIVALPDKNITRDVATIFRKFEVDNIGEVTLENFRVWMSKIDNNFRTPNIAEIKKNVGVISIYTNSAKKTNYVLKMYELSLRNNRMAEFSINEKLSIEHIMPQNKKSIWFSGLDEDEMEIKYSDVHLLGNLTLLTKNLNSSLKDSSFSAKVNGKDGLPGIKDDTLKMNEIISNIECDFDNDFIQKRSVEMVESIDTYFNEMWK